MLAHGEDGHVVNTCSMTSVIAAGNMYGICKHAILAMTEVLAADLAAADANVADNQSADRRGQTAGEFRRAAACGVAIVLHAVRQRSTPVVPIEDGRRALALALDIVGAIREHGRKSGSPAWRGRKADSSRGEKRSSPNLPRQNNSPVVSLK